MTRQDITQMAKDALLEYKGSTGAESPQAWPLIVTQAANDVARRTNAYYGSAVRAVTAGVSDYPLGGVYAVRRVTCADGAGNTPALTSMSMDDLNLWGTVQGFTNANGSYATGAPSIWIWLAANAIRLIPVPTVTVASGLVIEGLAYPMDIWPDAIDECPLDPSAHIAVAYRAAIIRSAQFPSADNAARASQLAAIYQTEINAANAVLGQTARVQSQVDASPSPMGVI